MLVWFLMLGSIFLVWFFIPDALGKKKKKLIFLGFAFSIIVFVVGGRDNGFVDGTDLFGYYRWYQRAMNLPLKELLEYQGVEDGYLVLNKVLATIVPWNQFIIYFQAAFCTAVMFWYIYRNVENVLLGVIVYVCVGPWQFFLTGFRQSIACCICFIALELIKKRTVRNDIIGILLIVLATTMHTTAWLFLAVFIIRFFKVGKGIIAFSIVVTGFILLFSEELMDFGNKTLGRDYEAGLYSGNTLAGLVPILVYIITLVLCYFAWHNDKSFTDDYSMEIKLMIFGLCLYTLRYDTTLFERMSHYFTPVISVLLPSAIQRQKNESERRIVSAICIILCMILFVYRVFAQVKEHNFYWQ